MKKWSMVLTFLLLLTSCDYKELCYDHRHYIDLKVIFDWQKSPDADVAGMTVLYYSQTNTSAEPVRYDYTGMNGGTAQLTQDTYRAATYNYDTETILYRNMQSAATVEAYTRRSTIEEGTRLATYTRGYPMPKARGAEDEPVILEPDPLWATVGSDVEHQRDSIFLEHILIEALHRREAKLLSIIAFNAAFDRDGVCLEPVSRHSPWICL